MFQVDGDRIGSAVAPGHWVVVVDSSGALKRVGRILRIRAALEATTLYFDKLHAVKKAGALADIGLWRQTSAPQQVRGRLRRSPARDPARRDERLVPGDTVGARHPPLAQLVTGGWTFFEDVESAVEAGAIVKTLKKSAQLPGIDAFMGNQVWEAIQAHRGGNFDRLGGFRAQRGHVFKLRRDGGRHDSCGRDAPDDPAMQEA